jgi:thioesterase domain-containing protein/acyl carrier protein
MFFSRLGARLHHQYGPTEATVDVTVWECAPVERRERIPIGRPIGNARAYILDADLQPAPVGVPGELCLGGRVLARGYLNLPGLTAERFIPDPFGASAGARLYRTGDLARYLPGGEIEFLGRIDQQVKVRGYRIEPGEVEAALAAHPRVRESVVVAREYSPNDKRLVAYIVPAADAAAEELTAEARDFLRQRLPDYMIPSSFVVLDGLPLTPNGKVDRKSLPAPDAVAAAGEYAAPETPTEEVLQTIWQAALSAPTLSVTACFDELGGHSLLAIHLIMKVNKHFDSALQLPDLFRLQTVRKMAAYLDARRHLKDEGQASIHPNLLELKPGDPRARPLFLVHPVGGYAHSYGELAVGLDYEGPVFGLQVNGDVPESVEAMAERYVEAVGRVQPGGPYLLGGWSMGGVVAYEMARQLRAAGEDVGLLLMMDSHNPAPDGAEPGAPDDDERGLLRTLASELGITAEGLSPSETEALGGMGPDELLATILRLGKEQNRLPADFDLHELRQRHAVTLRNSTALRAYRPAPLDVEVRLIRAEENGNTDPTLGWGPLAAGVSVTKQGGDHFSMMRRPHVSALSGALGALVRAHAAGPGPDDYKETPDSGVGK